MSGERFVNCVVDLLRQPPADTKGQTLVEREPKVVLADRRAAIQEPSRRERETVLANLPDIEWRVLIPRSWTMRPQDLVVVKMVERDKARYSMLNGAWMRLDSCINSHQGMVGYAGPEQPGAQDA